MLAETILRRFLQIITHRATVLPHIVLPPAPQQNVTEPRRQMQPQHRRMHLTMLRKIRKRSADILYPLQADLNTAVRSTKKLLTTIFNSSVKSRNSGWCRRVMTWNTINYVIVWRRSITKRSDWMRTIRQGRFPALRTKTLRGMNIKNTAYDEIDLPAYRKKGFTFHLAFLLR